MKKSITVKYFNLKAPLFLRGWAKFILFYLLLNSTILYSQTPKWQWARGGGSNMDCNANINTESCKWLGVDGNGNVYGMSALGTGFTQIDSSTFNGYSYDDFAVFSYKCDGLLRWVRYYGSPGNDVPAGLTVDNSGNVFVSGLVSVSQSGNAHFGDTIIPSTTIVNKSHFIQKLDSNGHSKFLFLPGPNIQTINDICDFLQMETDCQGNQCVLVHFWYGPTNWNGYNIPSKGYYILKFDKNNGNLMSLKKIDISGNFLALEFCTSKNSNYYFLGNIIDTAKVGSHIITCNTNGGIDSSFVACLDSNGQYLWHRQIGGNVQQIGNCAFALKPFADSTNIYVTGGGNKKGADFLGQVLTNPLDTTHSIMIIAKLDAFNGNLNWAIRLKTMSYTALSRLSKMDNNTLVGAGEYGKYVILNNNDTVKPYATNGNLFVYNLDCQTGYANWGIGTKTNNGGNDAYTTTTYKNNIYVGGMYSDSLYDSYGNGIHSTGGSSDFFIAKISATNDCGCTKAMPKAQVISLLNKTLTVKGNATGTLDSLYWFWGDGTHTKYLTQNSNISHTYQNSGTYSVCLRTYNYCGTQDSCTQVIITGINETELKEIKTYPNPVNNNLTIENPYYKDLKVTILNSMGLLLFQKQYENQTITIDMSMYAPGVYFVEIQTNDGRKTVKKVVKN